MTHSNFTLSKIDFSANYILTLNQFPGDQSGVDRLVTHSLLESSVNMAATPRADWLWELSHPAADCILVSNSQSQQTVYCRIKGEWGTWGIKRQRGRGVEGLAPGGRAREKRHGVSAGLTNISPPILPLTAPLEEVCFASPFPQKKSRSGPHTISGLPVNSTQPHTAH